MEIQKVEKKLEELDMDILRMLQQDATSPYKRIGGDLGKADSTIWNHVKALTDKGVITGIKAQIDPTLLGIHAVGCIYLHTTVPKEILISELSAIEGLRSCTAITGKANVKVSFGVENTKTFADIKERIARIPNVIVKRSYLEIDEIIRDRGFEF